MPDIPSWPNAPFDCEGRGLMIKYAGIRLARIQNEKVDNLLFGDGAEAIQNEIDSDIGEIA